MYWWDISEQCAHRENSLFEKSSFLNNLKTSVPLSTFYTGHSVTLTLGRVSNYRSFKAVCVKWNCEQFRCSFSLCSNSKLQILRMQVLYVHSIGKLPSLQYYFSIVFCVKWNGKAHSCFLLFDELFWSESDQYVCQYTLLEKIYDVSFQYNIEKKVNDEDEDEDDSDFEGSKAAEEDLDGMACKFANLCDRLFHMTTQNIL